LDWNDPEGGNITYFIWRASLPNRKATTQLWLINGGPGDTGSEIVTYMGPLVEYLLEQTNFDIMMPDHRGTGILFSFYRGILIN
jgi:hypothetical protein